MEERSTPTANGVTSRHKQNRSPSLTDTISSDTISSKDTISPKDAIPSKDVIPSKDAIPSQPYLTHVPQNKTFLQHFIALLLSIGEP